MNRRAFLLAGVAAISGVGGLFLARDRNSPLSLPELGAAHAETPAEPAGIVEMVLGSNDAPITLVEYASCDR